MVFFAHNVIQAMDRGDDCTKMRKEEKIEEKRPRKSVIKSNGAKHIITLPK